jgi:hypothetical protein
LSFLILSEWIYQSRSSPLTACPVTNFDTYLPPPELLDGIIAGNRKSRFWILTAQIV